MPRGADWPLDEVHVLGNLFLANRLAADGFARGADLTLVKEILPAPGDVGNSRTIWPE